jgi:uncharacterized protein YndB with AHSA1/START domain
VVAVARDVGVRLDEVFAALVDPRTYPHWLVGARDIRAVDADWPKIGTKFHHRVGLVGPLKMADSSKVLAVESPEYLSLEVRVRPLGRARATFRLAEPAGGRESAAAEPRTRVEFEEVPLGRLKWFQWALDPLAAVRNRRSLDKLADYLEEGRSHRFPG